MRTIRDQTAPLEEARALAAHVSGMIGSHDLRAPLSVISLSCTVIRQGKGELPPRVAENLDRIQRSVTYMTELVGDLLALAQVGSAPLARAEIDLTQMSEDVVSNLKLGSPGRDATVAVAPGLRCTADPRLMRAAMENLIGNAWKYSSRVASAKIEIGKMAVEGREAFFVKDNGAGFDMKEAHRLFAPFERLHKAADFEGTGVGLAAVQRIMDRHGGRIWAESEPDRGATFYFELQ